jgi:hypothetical protein
MPSTAERTHELTVRRSFGRSKIDDAFRFVGHFRMSQKQIDRACKVVLVYPRKTLIASSLSATQPEAGDARKDREEAARI